MSNRDGHSDVGKQQRIRGWARLLFACLMMDLERRARRNARPLDGHELWESLSAEARTIQDMLFPSPYVDAVTDIAVAVTVGHGSTALAGPCYAIHWRASGENQSQSSRGYDQRNRARQISSELA